MILHFTSFLFFVVVAGVITFVGNEATLALDSYPAPYSSNLELQWVVSDPDSDVRFDFEVSDLNVSAGDVLSLGSGTTVGENVLVSYSDISIDQLDSLVELFVTETNGGWISFTSNDDDQAGRGFFLNILRRGEKSKL